ncbi:MAG: GNAT family N-acetyltransferase [Nannocystaceae bacterium]
MRRSEFEMPRADAIALLARAPSVTVATVDPEGRPHLRVLHPVIVDDALYFHGSVKGERSSMIGWPAVVSVDEVVAGAPSYFFDPVRACPATTFYVSVQVRGVIEAVDDPVRKAAALEGLMRRFQPEGGYATITADDPAYVGPIAGVAIQAIPLTELVGKAKLAQNRRPADVAHLLDRLWARGDAGDPEAIERIAAANPGTPRPAFLRGPGDVTLHLDLGPADLDAALALVADTYWNEGVDPAVLRRAHLGSSAWVGARDRSGALIATARAVGDGAKHGWIYDVAVAPEHRGRGVGAALLGLLLEHPVLRGALQIHLQTRDAHPFYRRFGFVDLDPGAVRPRMIRRRSG